ncbi:peptidase M24, structural domain-containing protein [Aspergillus pseudoustus]|uniref:Peptidase M24, structural domain-containing protein n=1 Tax=Aspergillus pseudoustus TaxID=1810923 RepID=A0ABR4JKE8_9EURO
MATLSPQDQKRASYLLDAQNKAVALFKAIEPLVRPGVSEKALNKEIYDLGAEYGVRSHWHKRLIRSGPNTLLPFADNPPDRVIEADDIVVVDLGPVFEAYEADFGRTFVLGNDSQKLKLRDALEPVWNTVRDRYREDPDMTGDRLYAIATEEAERAGWVFGAELAGHLVGSFPHERIPNDKIALYVKKGNTDRISSVGKDGLRRHWILEIHLRDPEGRFGGFYEQLLTI